MGRNRRNRTGENGESATVSEPQTNGRTPDSKKEGRIPLDIDLLSYDQQVLKPEDWQKEYVRLAFRHASFT